MHQETSARIMQGDAAKHSVKKKQRAKLSHNIFSALTAFIAIVFAGLAGQAKAAQAVVAADTPNLEITCGDIPLISSDSLLLMDKNWKGIVNLRQQKGKISVSKSGGINYEWKTAQGSLKRSVEKTENGALIVNWKVSFIPGLKAKHMELTVSLPRGTYDRIPAQDNKTMGVLNSLTQPFELDSMIGKLCVDPTGSNVAWQLDDLRTIKWSGNFRLRIHIEYDAKKGIDFNARLKLRLRPEMNPAFVTLPVEKGNSRGLTDEIAGDGKGGWTDQGANDMRSLPKGLLVASGVPLNVSKQAVLLKGEHTPTFPESSGIIPVEPAMDFSTLYLFHTTAWGAKFDTPAVFYRLTYADGSKKDVPVKYGRDINDWWAAHAPTDAKLAWIGQNGSTDVGVSLFKIDNPQPGKALAGLEMVSAKTTCTPALIAATLLKTSGLSEAESKTLAKAFEIRKQEPVDTSNWFPCAISWRGPITPGSALDFSFMNQKPAGQQGFLKRSGESFVFEKTPNNKVRFWGSNSAIHGPFPAKDIAADIAKGLAAQGVNIVRMHLYAIPGSKHYKLLVNEEGELDPTRLDQMEFYINELKRNGIYIFMDLNDGLPYDALIKRKPLHDKAKAEANGKPPYKLISIYDPDWREAAKNLARKLFTHVNPYTGYSMVDDPAVAMYEIINECSMFCDWGANKPLSERIPEPYYSELVKKWNEWLKAEGLPATPLPLHFNLNPISRKFATQLQADYLNDMAACLRGLGVKAPISGINITFSLGDMQASKKMDYMGEHGYWAHPNCKARPMTYPTAAVLEKPVSHLPLISSFATGSAKGWPLVIGEWNFCFPNDRRCEGIPYTAAYSAYQDWDGLIFYGSTGSFDSGRWDRFRTNPGILVHSQQTDPATWGFSQVGAAIFRRGDVQTAKRDLEVVITDKEIADNLNPVKRLSFLVALGKYTVSFGEKANWLGELVRSKDGGLELYNQVLEKIKEDKSNVLRTVSDTGELRRYGKKALFLVDTPRTQAVSGKLFDLPMTGDQLSDVRVTSPMRWGSLAVTSIDGNEIAKSKRILITAAGNARNETTKCDAISGVMQSMGKAPVLAEPIVADISLRHPSGHLRAFTLNPLTGDRMKELPVKAEGEFKKISLTGEEKTIYFEVIAE